MSLFGSFDLEEDTFFGHHMRTMRQMNNMMNSLFADPFGMMGGFGSFDNPALTHRNAHNSLMPFAMPAMPNLNRLLSSSLDDMGNSHSYSSSTVVSMTSGPDGRPQVYKATSSTRCAPGGIKETQKSVSDSRTGTKKMSIGHHIGERAHIIEKEQNVHTGDNEERQDFINLDEDEAEDFNNEWETKARSRELPRIGGSSGIRNRHSYGGHSSALPAIMPGPSRRQRHNLSPVVSARRSIRSSPLVNTTSAISNSGSSSRSSPYSQPGQAHIKKSKIKSVKGSSTPPPAPEN